MAKYRKKPVVIDAIQLTYESVLEVLNFMGGNVVLDSAIAHDKFEDYKDIVKKKGLSIPTLEGEMTASINDYIIKGIQGEFYPCKPDIFKATYEIVGD